MSGTTGADLSILSNDFDHLTKDMNLTQFQLMAIQNALNRLKKDGWQRSRKDDQGQKESKTLFVTAAEGSTVHLRDVNVNCNVTRISPLPVDPNNETKFKRALEAYNRANAMRCEAKLIHEKNGHRIYCTMCPNHLGVKIHTTTFTENSIEPFLKTHVAGGDHKAQARKFMGVDEESTTPTKPKSVDEVTDVEVTELCAGDSTWKKTEDNHLIHNCGFEIHLKSQGKKFKYTKNRLEHNMKQHVQCCGKLQNQKNKPAQTNKV